MYNILPYSYTKAKELNVIIAPSKNPRKKIDVFKENGKFLCSVGAYGMGDYPSYMQQKGKQFADERRRLYRVRHKNDINKIGTPGYYAGKLLW